MAGRGDRRHHVTGARIYLVDAGFCDLIQVLAVEGGAGVACSI
jgi:hypothetical protein